MIYEKQNNNNENLSKSQKLSHCIYFAFIVDSGCST